MRNTFPILVLLFLFATSSASPTGRIRMIFRYDDYTLIPSPLNDTLLSIFKRNKIPLTIGVIPYDERGSFINQFDKNELDDLRSRIRNNEIEVALHGFNHQNIVKHSMFKRKYLSEFASEKYSVQYYKIKSGKNALDSLLKINIETFIPPFDTYDKHTLDALTATGFNTISASIFGATSGVTDNKRLLYVPATIRDFNELTGLLTRYKDEDVTIILYFHPYTFRSESLSYSDEYDPSRQITTSQLDSLLSHVRKQNIEFYTFSSLGKVCKFDKSLYDANYYKDNLVQTFLYKFKKDRYGVYSSPGFHAHNRGLVIWNLLLHIGIFCLVFYSALCLVKIFRPGLFLIAMTLSLMIVAVCVFLYYFIDDSSFRMKLFLLIVIVSATVLGALRGKKSNLNGKRKQWPQLAWFKIKK